MPRLNNNEWEARPSRDEWLMALALVTALRSTCRRRAVGCVFADSFSRVLSTGYNGNARGLPHCIETPCLGVDDLSGNTLRCEAVHAEQNCALMLRDPMVLHACYTTVSCCESCVKLLLNTGCHRIIFLEEYENESGLAAKKLWIAGGRSWEKLNVMKSILLETLLESWPMLAKVR